MYRHHKMNRILQALFDGHTTVVACDLPLEDVVPLSLLTGHNPVVCLGSGSCRAALQTAAGASLTPLGDYNLGNYNLGVTLSSWHVAAPPGALVVALVNPADPPYRRNVDRMRSVPFVLVWHHPPVSDEEITKSVKAGWGRDCVVVRHAAPRPLRNHTQIRWVNIPPTSSLGGLTTIQLSEAALTTRHALAARLGAQAPLLVVASRTVNSILANTKRLHPSSLFVHLENLVGVGVECAAEPPALRVVFPCTLDQHLICVALHILGPANAEVFLYE